MKLRPTNGRSATSISSIWPDTFASPVSMRGASEVTLTVSVVAPSSSWMLRVVVWATSNVTRSCTYVWKPSELTVTL